MKDLTRVLQDYCADNNIVYHYGIKRHLNLLEGNQVEGEVYMLHEPSTLVPDVNDTKTGHKSFTFTGGLFLTVKSTIDMPYFKEKQVTDDVSKFTLNIEPMKQRMIVIEKDLMCMGIDIKTSIHETTNLLDFNCDGVFVKYTIVTYE